MESNSKPENMTVYRKRGMTALGGILSLLLAASLIALVTVAYILTPEETIKDVKTSIIIAFVGVGIASFVLLLFAVLNFNNLRYPIILATDEKGIYDCSGFVHCGFIPWDDISKITGGGRKIETFLDILEDGSLTDVKIELKNYKRTFASRSKLWRALFLLSGFGCAKVRTLCSPLSKKQTYALLCERLAYYTANNQTENF